MSNQRGQTRDTTFLSLKLAETRGFIHRDYIAHCFRWSHVLKRLMQGSAYKGARILDIGCGRELPFPKLLHSNRVAPQKYVGMDAGPILPDSLEQIKKGKMEQVVTTYERTPFGLNSLPELHIGSNELDKFTHIICFEVLEHVEPNEMHDMLQRMKELITDDGTIFISTPCWDRKSCAANHVNEMRYDALGSVFEASGFHIKDVFGTFASITDYKDHLTPAYQEVFNDLREYYDSNVLSTFLAPMIPALSRNCLWELGKGSEGKTPMFEGLANCGTPWGSSEVWHHMEPDIKKRLEAFGWKDVHGNEEGSVGGYWRGTNPETGKVEEVPNHLL